MDVATMRRREDFDSILVSSVERVFCTHFRSELRVALGAEAYGNEFCYVPLLGGYLARSAVPRARLYLADAFRGTPRWWRIVPQWALGTALASKAFLRSAPTGFTVFGRVPHVDHLVVVPGNQRVRLFDFSAGTCLVLQKTGFDRASLEREVSARVGREPPWLPILDHDLEAGWLLEPIVDGFALPRLPAWRSQRRLGAAAERLLERVTAASRVRCETDELLEPLLLELQRLLAQPLVAHLAPEIQGWIDAAAQAVRHDQHTKARMCHGDFQLGNILVERGSDRIWLIDWEHSRKAFDPYDRLVWKLGTRCGRGSAARIRAHAQHDPASATALGWLVLEELRFFLQEACAGPYDAVPEGLTQWCGELRGLGRGLVDVLG